MHKIIWGKFDYRYGGYSFGKVQTVKFMVFYLMFSFNSMHKMDRQMLGFTDSGNRGFKLSGFTV